jgi:hypothetical protein
MLAIRRHRPKELPVPRLDPPDPPHRARQEDDLARWREALHLLPLAVAAPPPPGTHLRVLFQPTFHAPACLTLHLQEGASTVELILPRSAVRDWVRQAPGAEDRSRMPPPPPGRPARVTAPVPAGAVARFQDAIAGIVLAQLGDTRPGVGRDGLLIDGEVVEEGVAGLFAAWSPTAAGEPDVFRVCWALLDLGRACLPDEQSQTALGQIQRYLHQR